MNNEKNDFTPVAQEVAQEVMMLDYLSQVNAFIEKEIGVAHDRR